MFARPINDIRWSTDSYITRQLMSEYPAPLLVRVTHGHCGLEDTDSLGQGQVIRVHRWLKQQRVIAIDARGQYLSIPLDFDILFEVVPDKKRTLSKLKTMSIAAVVRQYSLPRKVRISSRHVTVPQLLDAGHAGVRVTLGPIDLVRLHQEVYMNGNSINFGELDPSILSIPIHHELEMSVALGLGSGDTNWKRLMRELDNVVAKTVRFANTHGNRKITVYNSDTEATGGQRKTQMVADSIPKRHVSLGRAFYYGTLQRTKAGKPRPRSASVDTGVVVMEQRAPMAYKEPRAAARRFVRRKDSRDETANSEGPSGAVSTTSGSTNARDSASREMFLLSQQGTSDDSDDETASSLAQDDIIDDSQLYQPKSLFGSVSRLSLFRPKMWNGAANSGDQHTLTGTTSRKKNSYERRWSVGSLNMGTSISMTDLQSAGRSKRNSQEFSQRGLPDGRSVLSGMDGHTEVEQSTQL